MISQRSGEATRMGGHKNNNLMVTVGLSPTHIIDEKHGEDLGKVFHHCVPLSLEGFFEQYFDKISYPLVFLYIRHGRSLGFARLVLERFNQFKP